jgi:hypothetical protein
MNRPGSFVQTLQMYSQGEAFHPRDLTIGPRVVRVGPPMLDAISSADLIEAVDRVSSGPAIPTLGAKSANWDTVVGQRRMHPIRYGRD